MADPAILLEIITHIFQRTPPTADCDEPLNILGITVGSIYLFFKVACKMCLEQVLEKGHKQAANHAFIVQVAAITFAMCLL